MRLSARVEWLFATEEPDLARRIHRTAAARLDAVEFWTWQDKPLDALEAALKATGISLTAICAEPMIDLTDAANREDFLAGLAASIATAKRLDAGILIAQAGDDLGIDRKTQRQTVVATLRATAGLLAGTGVVLGLKPLNTKFYRGGARYRRYRRPARDRTGLRCLPLRRHG